MAFIVIEGLDGAGKSTQIELFQSYLRQHDIAYKFIHFPRTDKPSLYGDLIARFLRGEFGENHQVDPYLVALLYAGDRLEAAADLRKGLEDASLLLMDRYVYSNIGYQCAKVENKYKRKALMDWIWHLEYVHHGIPKPDLNIFLDVPFSFTRSKLQDVREGNARNYLKGADDIHEKDMHFQESVRQVYMELIDNKADMVKIDCAPQGSMLSPELIHGRILEMLRKEGLV